MGHSSDNQSTSPHSNLAHSLCPESQGGLRVPRWHCMVTNGGNRACSSNYLYIKKQKTRIRQWKKHFSRARAPRAPWWIRICQSGRPRCLRVVIRNRRKERPPGHAAVVYIKLQLAVPGQNKKQKVRSLFHAIAKNMPEIIHWTTRVLF